MQAAQVLRHSSFLLPLLLVELEQTLYGNNTMKQREDMDHEAKKRNENRLVLLDFLGEVDFRNMDSGICILYFNKFEASEAFFNIKI